VTDRIEKEAAENAFIMRYVKRITLMLLLTGMRLGELYKLKWEKHTKNDKIILKRTETKQRKEKVIPITDSIRKTLDSMKDSGNKEYVFPLSVKAKRDKLYLTNLINRIRKYSGIEDFIFYNLKHTAASIMISEALGRGASLQDVMKILGHSQLKTTLHYVHSDFGRMKNAMKALENAIKK